MSSCLKMEPDAFLEFLCDLDQSLRKFDHSIRSPLSVLLGIVEDLEAGRLLDSEDISDARIAVERITKLSRSLSLPHELTSSVKINSAVLAQTLRILIPEINISYSVSSDINALVAPQHFAALVGLVATLYYNQEAHSVESPNLLVTDSTTNGRLMALVSNCPVSIKDINTLKLIEIDNLDNKLEVAKISETNSAILKLYLLTYKAKLFETEGGFCGIMFPTNNNSKK